MQSQELLKVAHQLIETANQLIKVANTPTNTTVVHSVDLPNFGEEFRKEVDKEMLYGRQAEPNKPSPRSEYSSNEEKVEAIRSNLEHWEAAARDARTQEGRAMALRKVSAFRGHLTKALKDTKKANGGVWKSRV